MPEVRAVESFYDVAEKTVRNDGSEWYCDDKRARFLAACGMVTVIGVPTPDVEPEPEPEPAQAEAVVAAAPKRTRRKKAE